MTRILLPDVGPALTVSDVLAATADREFVALRRHRTPDRQHRAADVLTSAHAAHQTLAPVTLDVAVLLSVCLALTPGPLWWHLSYAPLAVALAYIGHLYSDRDTVQTRGVLWYTSRAAVPVSLAGAVGVALAGMQVGAATQLTLAALVALTGVRGVSWIALVLLRRKGFGLRRTLIVGDTAAASTVWRRLVEFPEAGLVPIQLLGYEQAHDPGRVAHELSTHRIQHVVLVAPGPQEALITAQLPRHHADAPYFSTVPPLADLFLDPRSITEVGGIPLIPLGRVTRARRDLSGKRCLDVLLSASALLVLAPFFAVLALAVRLGDGGPAFYSQLRVGRDGKMFPMRKFRSMVTNADALLAVLAAQNESDGLLFKMRDDPRITRLGKLLRKSSLDELPQLWNVLVGQMSLVGPRPLPVDPSTFTPMEAERHSVLPGITGYWQLSGGPGLTYDEMVRLDLAYIRNWSLWLDLRLLLRTVPAMLHRHGAS